MDLHNKAVLYAIFSSIVGKSLHWTKAQPLSIVVNVNGEV